MEQKHSPLPWKADRNFVRDINSGNIYVANCMSWSDLSAKANAQGKTKLLDIDKAKANAQFIVRACNAYEELLKSLKDIVTRIEEKDANIAPSHTCLEAKYVAKAAITKAEAKGGDVKT
jgi:hypothetical protein